MKSKTTHPHLLQVRAAQPDWFREALAAPKQSRFADVEGCPVHYLLWGEDEPHRRGLLLVHGSAAHAQWWSFIAPFLAERYRVAAIDLSGLGDSGRRASYGSALRARELRAVMQHAGFGEKPVVVAHSYGGMIAVHYAAMFGAEAAGVVLVDSPTWSEEEELKRRGGRSRWASTNFYPSFEAALERFRLIPAQPCENAYIMEHIARHSLTHTDAGWTWKFDPGAMASLPDEPSRLSLLPQIVCRMAHIYGDKSVLVSQPMIDRFRALVRGPVPAVGIPDAHHHVMLDQPLAFVAALRAVLDSWEEEIRTGR